TRHEQRIAEQPQEKAERLTLGRLDDLERRGDTRADAEIGGRHAEERGILVLLERERRHEGIAKGVESFGLPVGEIHLSPCLRGLTRSNAACAPKENASNSASLRYSPRIEILGPRRGG